MWKAGGRGYGVGILSYALVVAMRSPWGVTLKCELVLLEFVSVKVMAHRSDLMSEVFFSDT